MSKSSDYWAGYHAEDARLAGRDAARSYAADAAAVARNLRRDDATKQRILKESPHLSHSLDAAELESMSAAQLATLELKQYGVKVSDSNAIEVRDAFRAGRRFEARDAAASRRGFVTSSGGSMAADEDDSLVGRYIAGK